MKSRVLCVGRAGVTPAPLVRDIQRWRCALGLSRTIYYRLGDTGLVTSAAPTPVFRRFPWTQLVFCIACLSMTAWTWMRYSYAWDRTPAQLLHMSQWPKQGEWPQDAYVALECHVARWLPVDESVSQITIARDTRKPSSFIAIEGGASETVVRDAKLIRTLGQPVAATVSVLRGRLSCQSTLRDGYVSSLAFTVGSHRLSGPSIAGLVVGAMGCIIFGLYFREWVRARKALAQAPDQDMIA